MKNLVVFESSVAKKGFGSRYEFSAIVSVGWPMRLRVCFPLKASPGAQSKSKQSRLLWRGMNELRRVVCEGRPMPGYWSLNKV